MSHLAVILYLAFGSLCPQVSALHDRGSKAGGWGVKGSGHHHSGPAAHITTGRRAHAVEHTGWSTRQWACFVCVCNRLWQWWMSWWSDSFTLWEQQGVTDRQTDEGVHPAVSSPLRLFLFLSAASVCTLIKTLNLFLKHTLHLSLFFSLSLIHTHTHAHKLTASLKANTKDLVYSPHIFFA